MRALVVLVLVAGCAHPQIAVHGGEVLHHLDELGRDGSAQLETVRVDGDREQAADGETVFLYQTVTFDNAVGPLSHFVDGCGPFAGVRPCRLRVGDRIVLRDVDSGAHDASPRAEVVRGDGQSSHAANKAVAATFFFGGLAGMGLCIALCEDHKVGYSVALASGGLVALVVWAILDGAHD